MTGEGDASCPNCGAPHERDDIFCESCGYEFLTGSLPSAAEAEAMGLNSSGTGSAATGTGPTGTAGPTGSVASGDGSGTSVGVSQSLQSAQTERAPERRPLAAGAGPARIQVDISADRGYFDTVVSEGELTYPDPAPGPRQLVVTGNEIHIGRASQSRAIHPDIDVTELTGDPAVSSRHAVVRVGVDGKMTVTDVGSTNGTIVGPVEGDTLTVGHETTIDTATPVYVGAWTRLIFTLVP